MGWQRHQLDHIQIICTLLQIGNHSSASSLSFTGRMLFLILTPNEQCQSDEGKHNKAVIGDTSPKLCTPITSRPMSIAANAAATKWSRLLHDVIGDWKRPLCNALSVEKKTPYSPFPLEFRHPAGGEPSHGHRQHAQKTWQRPRVWFWKYPGGQTDRHTCWSQIAILRHRSHRQSNHWMWVYLCCGSLAVGSVVVELGIRRRLRTCCKRQDELSQKNGLIDSLRNELDTAREEKNQTQQRYNDQMNEIDAIRHERDDVKKSCEVI